MLKHFKTFAFLIPLSFFIFLTAAQTLKLDLNQSFRLPEEKIIGEPTAQEPALPAPPAPIMYGIATDSLEIMEAVVEKGESLSQILAAYNIQPATIHALGKKAKGVFPLRRISYNRPYTLLHLRDSAQTAQYFIYEPSELEYVIYDLRGELSVVKEKREVEVREQIISGLIQRSLFDDILAAGGSPQLVNGVADIYAWRLNLNRVQPGDKFKLIYEEKFVNGTPIGIGKIKAAYFEQGGRPLYAIGFDRGRGLDYFDQDGKSLKKAFLKEPLEYTRISSRFSNNRFHPVQKRFKPHLGTDFAAPRGTPIRTVGDGKVVEAGFTKGNGRYVKIQHDKTYTTQYLHMSKFAKGIRAGAHVQQGQTIGYVGSTGLATGPHLCYRFWKNGKQVDALREKLPLANPIQKKHRSAFETLARQTMQQMQAVDGQATSQDMVASGKAGPAEGV